MKTMYYTTSDGCDGSSSVEFFESQECIDLLEDCLPDYYGMGEGGGHFEYEGTISIVPTTLDEVRQQIEDMG